MSQQINLLIQARELKSTLLPTLIGVGMVLVVLLIYWGFQHLQTVKLQQTANTIEQQLNAAKKNMQLLQQKKLATGEKAGDLDAQIAALKARSEAGQEILTLLQKGELGNSTGYAGYLTKLMMISQSDLWLTNVAITNAGKNVSITGRALNNDSIINYAKRLNQQFSDYGVQFTSVEMTPEVLGKENPAAPAISTAAAPLSTVVFKLF